MDNSCTIPLITQGITQIFLCMQELFYIMNILLYRFPTFYELMYYMYLIAKIIVIIAKIIVISPIVISSILMDNAILEKQILCMITIINATIPFLIAILITGSIVLISTYYIIHFVIKYCIVFLKN